MSHFKTHWQLPQAVADIMPDQSKRIESIRQQLFHWFACFGYDPVIPPMIEYLDTLLVGSGADLRLKTHQFVDQLSGHTLGVRADITPQISRIDMHAMSHKQLNRLCYCGSVLHTQPEHILGSREMLQMGAEIYGESSIGADLEVLQLLVSSLARIGFNDLLVDFSHAGVLRALLAPLSLPELVEIQVLAALRHKNRLELLDLLAPFDQMVCEQVCSLLELSGTSQDVVAAAKVRFGHMDQVVQALNELSALFGRLEPFFELCGCNVQLHVDLADLRGYHYHTGIMFTVYSTASHNRLGTANPLAYGGRYDNMGRLLGSPRPAVGFSFDLMQLSDMSPGTDSVPKAIAVHPNILQAENRDQWTAAIWRLREQGETVVQYYSLAQWQDVGLECNRQLIEHNDKWVVVELPQVPV